MRRYRSLVAWKVARELCLVTLRAADKHYHPRSRSLFDQLRRAAISVEANIVEGYALGTSALFQKHLRIAFGSAAEVDCLADLASELSYLPKREADRIRQLASRTLRLLTGLRRALRSKTS